MNTNSGEGSIQTLTIMRSLRRFAPQDDMNFEGNGKGTQKPLNGNGLIASSPYSPSPSRGMSEAKVEQESTETLSFRCDCERCRLVRGRIDRQAGKVAFTLAEVLITLGIIGVVAAMTLPTLNQAINKKVRAEQVRTVKYKFTKATDKMNSLGLIGAYDSTDAFVDELQKHLKIMKRCDNNNIRSCWAYDTINTATGSIQVSNLKNAQNLKSLLPNSKESTTVGIITADGTPMILAYSKSCTPLDPVKQYSWSVVDGKPETNATTTCVSMIFDVNGTKGPNKLGDDVRTLNSLIGMVSKGVNFSPLSYEDCKKLKNKLGLKYCHEGEDDYWAGAVKTCDDYGLHLPSGQTLAKLTSTMYGIQDLDVNEFIVFRNNCNGYTSGSSRCIVKNSQNAPISYPEVMHTGYTYGNFWSSNEVSADMAERRYIYPDGSGRNAVSRTWGPNLNALCVGD